MTDKQAGIYASAIGVLKRAIELDTANRLEEAVVCYQEGLQLLLDYLKGKENGIQFRGRKYIVYFPSILQERQHFWLSFYFPLK